MTERTIIIRCPDCDEDFVAVVVTELYPIDGGASSTGRGAGVSRGRGTYPHRSTDGTFDQGQKVLRRNAKTVELDRDSPMDVSAVEAWTKRVATH